MLIDQHSMFFFFSVCLFLLLKKFIARFKLLPAYYLDPAALRRISLKYLYCLVIITFLHATC